MRQPSTVWPSDCTTCSNFCSTWRRTVGLRGRKMMPLPYWPTAGKRMRALRQTSSLNACGICSRTPAPSPVFDFAAASAAVVEVLQYLDRLLEDPVRLVALDVDDETDAAGIVLVARIVEALFPRRPERHGRVLDHLGSVPGCEEDSCSRLMLGPAWIRLASVRRRRTACPGENRVDGALTVRRPWIRC